MCAQKPTPGLYRNYFPLWEQDFSLNPKFTDLARLAGQQASKILLSPLPLVTLGLQVYASTSGLSFALYADMHRNSVVKAPLMLYSSPHMTANSFFSFLFMIDFSPSHDFIRSENSCRAFLIKKKKFLAFQSQVH